GHLFGLTVGIGSSVFARAWIVAQKFRLRTALVVGSVAMDRLIDLAVFAAIAVAAVSLLPLPAGLDAPGRLAIVLTAAAIAAGLAILAGVLWAWRRRGFADAARPRFPTRWIPARFTAWWSHHSEAFVAGLDWPRERPRRILILLLAILIKALAVSDVLWAGWAVGVWLPAGDYLLIMVALGCLILFGFFFRVPGSNPLAAVLILTLFGIGREQAAAIMLLMQTGFLTLCALVGGPSLLSVGWPRRGRVSAPASPAAEVAQGGDGSTNPLS
ncbi:MAG: flippase-like domain-containing protein, partial [Gammaproteobacteria bacterium]|nr:flippase-like domain-containing protein [Gammaproteobacteria bacterium]